MSTRIAPILCLLLAGVLPAAAATAATDPDLPPAGVYWHSPRPDSLGRLVFPYESVVRLTARTVDLARISDVRFSTNGGEVAMVSDPPYTYDWTADLAGTVVLRAEALSGTTVVAVVEREVTIAAEGLRVRPTEVSMQLPPDGSGTYTLDLDNRGPDACEWVAYRRGGNAAIGNPGAVDKSFQHDYGLSGDIAYRDRGTSDTADDEIWFVDTNPAYDRERDIARRRVVDWSDAGVFRTDGYRPRWPWLTTFEFEPGLDELWRAAESGVERFGTTSGAVLEHISTGELDFSHETLGCGGSKARGVLLINDTTTDENYHWFYQLRDADGLMISAEQMGNSLYQIPNNERHQFQRDSFCWSSGDMWAVEKYEEGDKELHLCHWHPGMAVWERTATVDTGTELGEHGHSKMCRSAEPGWVWMWTNQGGSPSVVIIHHVDTGLRPWLRLTDQRGMLANGASTTMDLAIDATGVPEGVYQAEVCFTQYPYELLPQIIVQVTLTVGADGSRTITIGAAPENPLWTIDPAEGTVRDEGDATVFENLRTSGDYELTPHTGGAATN